MLGSVVGELWTIEHVTRHQLQDTMKLEVENCIWHAFDYLAMENGRQSANKSKLKVIIRNIEYWRDNWTVSDVTGHAGVTGRYLENAIISDKSKWR